MSDGVFYKIKNHISINFLKSSLQTKVQTLVIIFYDSQMSSRRQKILYSLSLFGGSDFVHQFFISTLLNFSLKIHVPSAFRIS